MDNNFNPGFDREKLAFLELANRGGGLDPINYIYAKDISCDTILSPSITGGTAELYTIYSNGVYAENIVQSKDVQTDTLEARIGTITTVNSTITNTDTLNSLTGNITTINSSNITNSEDIITNLLKWNNPDNEYYVGFKAGELNNSTIWSLPLEDGTDGQILSTNGDAILSFIDITTAGAAPKDAQYVLNQPNDNLANAQSLSQLIGGILKSAPLTGTISIAIPDIDYATVATLEELAAEASSSAAEASSSAAEASGSAAEASGSAAEASGSAAEATGAAGDASAAAVTAGISKVEAVAAAAEATGAAAEATGAAAEATGAAAEATGAAAEAVAAAAEATGAAAEAAISATGAGTSALAAAASAAAASGSASSASSSASEASDSADNASFSATDAQNYLNTLLSTGLNALPCTGNVSFQGFRLINLGPPIVATDGATKEYVDSAISSSSNLISLSGAISGSGQTGTVVNTILNSLIGLTTNQVFNFTGSPTTFNYDLTIPNSTNRTVKLRLNRANTGDGAGYEFQFYSPTNGVDTFTFGYNSGAVFRNIYSIANNASVINYSYSLNVNDAGTYKPYNGGYGYLNPSGSVGTASGQNSYSINCTNRIKASEFNAVSSKKIKNILGRGEEIEHTAIELFKKIPLFKYKYKDTIKEGNADHYGVIAEELAEVIPAFVNMQDEGWIPNIYKNCITEKGLDNSYTLYFNEKLENIEGNRLKLIFQDKEGEKHVEVMITEITADSLSVICYEKLPRDIFAYGTYSICPTVSKQKIFELALVVLQNLMIRIETLEKK